MTATETIPRETPVAIDDCWNRIGVWGRERPRCPQLDSVIHCMNCRIYADAARQLLDRIPDEDYLAGWTEQLKQGTDREQGNTVSAVVFRITNEWLALPARLFQEVVEMRAVHRVPHSKSGVLRGLVNIRGELQLCVSLGQLLGINKGLHTGTERRPGMRERMVVIADHGDRYAFPVTEVQGICRYAAGDLQVLPTTAGQAVGNYFKGILRLDDRHVGCLDEELIFSSLKRLLG
jgi:chemotaxis-related protein WspD